MDDKRDIEKSIARIEEKLDNVVIALNELITAWPHICRRIDRIESQLYGNGSPGLLVKVNALIYGTAAICAAVGVLISNIIMRWLGV